MSESDWLLAGSISVDAGTCWVGDPCYLVGHNRDTSSIADWGAFVEKLYPVQKRVNGEAIDFEQRGYQEFEDGVVCSTGVGDGRYSVYVKRSNGRIAAIKVVFLPGEAGEDEEEAEGGF